MNCISTPDPYDKVYVEERGGPLVECLTLDRGAAGSSLTGYAALCPLALSSVSTGQTQEDRLF